jgi:uncharacterized membrane protein YcaP (DUF421 family)
LCKSFGFTLPTKTISPFTHFDTFYILILNKNTGVLVESNYFHPVGSVIYLVVIALILIGVGYWRFKSREIL